VNQLQMGLDRRGGGRVPHRGEILVKGSRSTFQRGSACDLNESGARLLVPDQVQPGHSLVVYLKLEARRALSFLATVVWARPGAQGTEVGVRFEEGCLADRRFLGNWLHNRRMLAFS